MKKSFSIKITAILLAAGLITGLTGCTTGSTTGSKTSDSQTTAVIISETSPEAEMPSIDTKEKEAASQHLLAVWSDYLQVLDKMYASQLWALDYVEKYLESGDWKDLTKARTACIASVRYLSELSMTEEDLTEAEYLVLFDAGIDTAYQSEAFRSIPSSLEEAHRLIRETMLECLEADIFYSGRADILKEQVSVNKEYIQDMCGYECTKTNYMLFSLEEEALASEYWKSIPEQFPTLSMGYGEWINNEEELLNAGNANLDNLEEIDLKQSDLISSLSAQQYTLNQILENNDVEKLLSSAFIIQNTPEFLPMPDWYDPQTAGYLSFVLEADGSITYPESGDELGDAVYGVYIQVKDLTADDIDAYISLIKDMGEDARKGEEDKWYIKMSDYSVQISLENGVGTVLFNGQDVTFVPIWYLEI